jgi:pimeloyl-ACP methyl ester carboxylesterase
MKSSLGRSMKKKRRYVKRFAIGCSLIFGLFLTCIVAFYLSMLSGPDALDLTAYHPFRSLQAQDQFLALYDEREKDWPVSFETRMIETSYGLTYVRISGQESAPPLVLLHGAGSNSLVWETNVKSFSQSYRVIAIDNIYDYGRSIYEVEMQNSKDFALWLDEVFTYLKLGNNDVNLVGLSYGGWLTSQYALFSPARLDKIVMIAPASTVLSINFEWAGRATLALLPHRSFSKNFFYWLFEDSVNQGAGSQKFVDRAVEETYLARQCFKPKMMVNPTVLTDHELQQIAVPVLFLVGENEKMYSAQEAVERLKTVAPNIETKIIPNAGHDLTIVQADIVNETIMEFLEQ